MNNTLFAVHGPMSKLVQRAHFEGFVPDNASNALEAFQADALFGRPRVPLFDGQGRLAARAYEGSRFEDLRQSVVHLATSADQAWPKLIDVDSDWREQHSGVSDLRKWKVFVNDFENPAFRFSRHRQKGQYAKSVLLDRPKNGQPVSVHMGVSAYVNGARQQLEISEEGIKTHYDINLFGETPELARLFGIDVSTRNRSAVVFAMMKSLERFGYMNFKIKNYVPIDDIELEPKWVPLLLEGARTLTVKEGRELHGHAVNAPEIQFSNRTTMGSLRLGVYNEQGSEGALDEFTLHISSKRFSRAVQPLDSALYFWLWQTANVYITREK